MRRVSLVQVNVAGKPRANVLPCPRNTDCRIPVTSLILEVDGRLRPMRQEHHCTRPIAGLLQSYPLGNTSLSWV